MELIQQLAALITVSSAGVYFVTVLIKSYKLIKTNEDEIKQEAKEKVKKVVEQAGEIKEKVETKVEEKIQEKKSSKTLKNEPPEAQ